MLLNTCLNFCCSEAFRFLCFAIDGDFLECNFFVEYLNKCFYLHDNICYNYLAREKANKLMNGGY